MIDQDKEILLFAPDLLGESLAAEIPNEDLLLQVRLSADQLKGHPALVVWSLTSEPQNQILQREILQLQQRWSPAPLLLLLPADFKGDPQELLAHKRYQTLMTQLAAKFDAVLINTPALHGNLDAQLVAARSGAALMVARENHTPLKVLDKATHRLRELGVAITGVALSH